MPKKKDKKKQLGKAIRKAKREAEIQAGFVGKLYTRVADKSKSHKSDRSETKAKLNKGEYNE